MSRVHVLLLSDVGRIAGAGAAIGTMCAFGLVQVERGWMGNRGQGAAKAGITISIIQQQRSKQPPDLRRSIG